MRAPRPKPEATAFGPWLTSPSCTAHVRFEGSSRYDLLRESAFLLSPQELKPTCRVALHLSAIDPKADSVCPLTKCAQTASVV